MTLNPLGQTKPSMTPETLLILFVDVQPEIVASSKTNSPESVVRSAVALAKIGKLLKAPMYISVVPVGDSMPQLVPELARELADVPLLERAKVDVFADDPTSTAVAKTGRHDLVICGLISEAAVLLAAFSAIVAGYHVHVPVDACGGMSARTEDAAFRRMESFGAVTTSLPTLVAMLTPDLTSGLGQEMMRILLLLRR